MRGAIYILFALVVMTLLSLASYHFLEQPFLRMKKHFASKRQEPAASIDTPGEKLNGVRRDCTRAVS